MMDDIDESIALRVKRRRLNIECDESVQYVLQTQSYRHKKRIFNLPNEILSYIFQQLSFDEISRNVAAVCQRFEEVSINLMNRTFCNIETRINEIRAFALNGILSQSQNIAELDLKFHRTLNILDVLHYQFCMVRASIWRYSYFQLLNKDRNLALNAGLLLDYFTRVFELLMQKTTFERFTRIVSAEMQLLRSKVKEYIEKFEKYCCKSSINDPFNNGCKIIDLLECFVGSPHEVISENYDNCICNLKLKYKVDRAWMCVYILNNNCQPHDQIYHDLRFMFKRIQRLIRATNIAIIDHSLLTLTTGQVTRPYTDLYCGHGFICDKFYFYGTMTEGYFLDRFGNGRNNNNEIENGGIDEEDDDENNNFLFVNNVVNVNIRPVLTFDVNVTCPLHLAPMYFLKRSNCNGNMSMVTHVEKMRHHFKKSLLYAARSSTSFDNGDDAPRPVNEFNMSLVITSNIARENRLPYKYKYSIVQSSPDIISIIGEDIGNLI